MDRGKKKVTISSKLQELRMESDWDEFKQLAKLMAMRQAPDGTYYLGNWWRGPLLYALVGHYKPMNVLELGTGRGYGAISMAKASLDQGFECTIWTIDRVSPLAPQPWPIDEGEEPALKCLSLREVWEKYLPVEVRERIHCPTGDSLRVMRRWKRSGLPQIDFFFIDGGHDYWTVKHDFIAALQVANPGAIFVFDDYGARQGYGVKPLIDKEAAPKCPNSVEIIDTFAEQARPPSEGRVEHRMAIVDTKGIPNLLTHFYSEAYAKRFMVTYFLLNMGRNAMAIRRRIARSGIRMAGVRRQDGK